MDTAATDDLFRRHRISVTDYFRMGETGILAQDARVELIEGEIIDMAPIGQRHSGYVNRLTRLLITAVGRQAVVSVQNPVILGEFSSPEPDVCLLRAREDDYIDAHPEAGDVLVAVEVSDSSLRYDRNVKIPLYARFGIPEVWLVNLVGNRLLRRHDCDGATYRNVTTTGNPAAIAPVSLSDVTIDLSSLFHR